MRGGESVRRTKRRVDHVAQTVRYGLPLPAPGGRLIATTEPANSLTIFNAAAGAYGLQAGAVWFVLGFVLIIVYQVYAHRAFWGKVPITEQSADGMTYK